jgi:curved DNA-binding protein CbpA
LNENPFIHSVQGLTYFDLLELEYEERPSSESITKAFRRASLKWHPDKWPEHADAATERFLLISEAREILSDEFKLRGYLQLLKHNVLRYDQDKLERILGYRTVVCRTPLCILFFSSLSLFYQSISMIYLIML